MKAPVVLLFVIAVALCANTAAPWLRPTPVSAQDSPNLVPRFQLVSVAIPDLEATGIRPQQTALLLETQTGRVWRYNAPMRARRDAGDKPLFPSFFGEVNVDDLQGYDLGQSYRAWQKVVGEQP